jgi:hypothetical protein
VRTSGEETLRLRMCSVLLCPFRSACVCVCGGVFVDVSERAGVRVFLGLSVYKAARVRLCCMSSYQRLGGVSARRCWRIVRRVGRGLRRIAHRRCEPRALRGRQTQPTRGSRSSADAVGDAVGGPSGAAATACAHKAHTRMPQLWQRVGVCARACACRRCCRSRRWPAGKLRNYQRH